MKLLGSNTSPYVRKVRLVLLEKNIPHEYAPISPHEPGNPVSSFNPLGRVPALILDDGFCVFDSPVITDYVDTLNDSPILIPRNEPAVRLRVKRWEALADGIMDSAIMVRIESLRPQEKQDAAIIELHNTAITNALAYASQLLGSKEQCEGNTITLADLALVSALFYLNLRQAERDWSGAHTNLAALFARINVRRSSITANAG